MKLQNALGFGLVLFAGFALGGIAVPQLQAQGKGPGAYAIIDISEIVDPEGLKQLGPKAGPAATNAGGKYIVRTENIVSLDGTPPKRFVVVAFDDIAKAKAWYETPAQKEVDAIRQKALKSRVFVVEGM
jgi:uncharacterized protein (DUF1330 family)